MIKVLYECLLWKSPVLICIFIDALVVTKIHSFGHFLSLVQKPNLACARGQFTFAYIQPTSLIDCYSVVQTLLLSLMI